MVLHKVYLIILPLILAPVLLTAGHQSPQESREEPRFILIHLDGVSSYHFFREMEAGRLPNLQEAFSDHGIIPYAITFFPSKTPIVISNLHRSRTMEDTNLVGWASTHRDSDETFTGRMTFQEMVASKSRLGVTNFLFGVPLLDRLAGPALVNAADLIEEYPVLEFYWYGVDSYGHFFGEERYVRKIHQFDRQFGKLMRRLDPEINIIIYSDHGMIFNEGVDDDAEISLLPEGTVRSYSFPNLYLVNPDDRFDIAHDLIEHTRFDYIILREDEETIRVQHRKGVVKLHYREGEGIRYTYEENDLFGYYEMGYEGAYWSDDEWFGFSYDSNYPAAPFNIYYLLNNPRAGDLITIFNADKYSRTAYSGKGNHGGFTSRDLTTPLLVRGPDLEHLYGLEAIRLTELFREIPEFQPGGNPGRDSHTLSGRLQTDTGDTRLSVALSPAYRFRAGVDLFYFHSPERVHEYQIWGAADLYRGYLSRIWIGGGADFRSDKTVPLFQVQYEVRVQRLAASYRIHSTRTNEFTLSWKVSPVLTLELQDFHAAGIRLSW